jgi:aminopeptidase N
MHIPVQFGLVSAGSGDLGWTGASGADVTGDVIHLRDAKHTITFDGIEERPVVSLLRGFSAPVTIYPEPDDDALAFLARNDPDEYGRWQALSALVVRQMIQAASRPAEDRGNVFDEATCAIFSEIAGDEDYEHAYRALCLTLPGENDIAREIGNDIDPDAIHAVHRAASRQLGRAAEARFRAAVPRAGGERPLLAGCCQRRPAVAAQHRARLSVPCERRRFGARPRLYAEADNMTDRAHALSLLAHLAPRTDETIEALKAFQAEFRSEPIVMDKWFMIQATAPGAATLDTVKTLTGQPASPGTIRTGCAR